MSISFEDYTAVDHNIHITGQLNNEKIVVSIARLPDDDDSDKDEVYNHETFPISIRKDAIPAIKHYVNI